MHTIGLECCHLSMKQYQTYFAINGAKFCSIYCFLLFPQCYLSTKQYQSQSTLPWIKCLLSTTKYVLLIMCTKWEQFFFLKNWNSFLSFQRYYRNLIQSCNKKIYIIKVRKFSRQDIVYIQSFSFELELGNVSVDCLMNILDRTDTI